MLKFLFRMSLIYTLSYYLYIALSMHGVLSSPPFNHTTALWAGLGWETVTDLRLPNKLHGWSGFSPFLVWFTNSCAALARYTSLPIFFLFSTHQNHFPAFFFVDKDSQKIDETPFTLGLSTNPAYILPITSMLRVCEISDKTVGLKMLTRYSMWQTTVV